MHLAGFRYMVAETTRDLERIAREGGAEARLQAWNPPPGRPRGPAPTMFRSHPIHCNSVLGRATNLFGPQADWSRVYDGVEHTIPTFLARIRQLCEAALDRHAAVPADDYAIDEVSPAVVLVASLPVRSSTVERIISLSVLFCCIHRRRNQCPTINRGAAAGCSPVQNFGHLLQGREKQRTEIASQGPRVGA